MDEEFLKLEEAAKLLAEEEKNITNR